jgi:hypothetical protein
MRASVSGGPPHPVPVGGPFAGFRCPAVRGKPCVLQQSNGRQYVFYALDPMTGKGAELARADRDPAGQYDWDLSPDASRLAIVKYDQNAGRIRVIPLTAESPYDVTVKGSVGLRSVNWTSDGTGWYACARTPAGWLLLHIGRSGQAEVLRQTFMATWGVPSPDGRWLQELGS